jgi:5-methylthioadenosine/S-adenosylhomocysteine deaminase
VRSRSILLLSVLLTACADETVTPQEKEDGSAPDFGGFGDAPVVDSDGDATVDSTVMMDTSVTDSTTPPDIAVDTPSIDAGEGPTVTIGATNRFRLLGTVVTPTTAMKGEVLVKDQKIVCVADSCASHADATGATVIDTKGIIFPGLIDAHNHILYNVFDESDWSPPAGTLYDHANQWQAAPTYTAFKRDKYNPMIGSTATGGGDLDCEMDKFGEVKSLLAGTTSIVGHNGAANCYESVIRTLGSNDSDFGVDDGVSTNTLGVGSLPDPDAGSFKDAGSYVIHVAEGKPGSSIYSEFTTLESKGFLTNKTVIVHGTALGAADFKKMATAGTKLVWSPRSNVVLYGTTTDIPAARMAGVDIALAPDWALSGSINLLDELRYASAWDKSKWGAILSAKELVEMVTIKPAKMLAIDKWVGTIEVGKFADLMVIGGDATKPYDALLAVTPRDVRMTMVNGKILYGDEVLQKAAPTTPCEGIPICGRPKFICVAEAPSTTVKKLDQTLKMIQDALGAYTFTPDGGAATKPALPLPPLTTCPM